MPKTSLWYDKMSTGMQLRPQNQGTKGHRTHSGKENWVAPSWFVSFETFCTSNLISRFFFHFFLLFFRSKTSICRHKLTHSQAHKVKCHWGTYWGVDGGRFCLIFFSWSYNPVMRKKTYSTGSWEGRRAGESHIHSHVSRWSQTAPQDRDLSPIMGSFHTHHWHSLKIPTPLSFFFF